MILIRSLTFVWLGVKADYSALANTQKCNNYIFISHTAAYKTTIKNVVTKKERWI